MADLTEKLSTLDIRSDEYAHVQVLDAGKCDNCQSRPCCHICPSNVFAVVHNAVVAEHRRCIECGACVLACPQQNIFLDYPHGGLGVVYHQG